MASHLVFLGTRLILRRGRQGVERFTYNLVVRILSVLSAALVFVLLRPNDLSLLSSRLVIALLLAFAVNSLLLTSHVSWAISISDNLPFLEVLLKNYSYSELRSYALIPIPIAMILLWYSQGALAVALLAVPLLLASYTLRTVFERGQLHERIEREKHLAELGKSAAAVLHEVERPISRIIAEADFAAGEHSEAAPHFRRIVDWSREAGELSDQLLTALSGQIHPEWIHLNDFVTGIVVGLPNRASERIAFTSDVPAGLRVHWDRKGIRLVLENILLNAFEIQPRGDIRLELSERSDGPRRKGRPGHVILEITDRGPGLPPVDQDELYEPLFTTKQAGTGIGLYLSNQLIKGHGGELKAHSSEEGGATFVVDLPVKAEA
jgi:signal transduction histidine kinase